MAMHFQNLLRWFDHSYIQLSRIETSSTLRQGLKGYCLGSPIEKGTPNGCVFKSCGLNTASILNAVKLSFGIGVVML